MVHRRQVTFRTVTVLSLLALAAPVAASPGAPGGPGTADGRGEMTSPLQSAASNQLFIQNVGQFDPAVRFQLRSKGATWWFTDNAVWFTVAKPDHGPRSTDDGQDATGDVSSMARRPWSGVNLRLTFAGMSPDARLVASNPQRHRSIILLGNVAAGWHTTYQLSAPCAGRTSIPV